MNLKSLLAKPFAHYIANKVKKEAKQAVQDQASIFKALLKVLKHTQFGKDHGVDAVQDYDSFKKAIPIRDYERFVPYINMIKEGKQNILWKGLPIYFAKTSGTTSGVKYIPITKDSIDNHINTARNALLCYMAETGNTGFASGKLIFLSGSPELERIGNIATGRLSGIVNHHVPAYLRSNQLPSYETNCIEDWEQKLDAIVSETMDQDMTLISGIPPWVQMYFDRLESTTGKKIGELFPNFNVMVQIFDESPTRLCLQDVELGVNYALIINSNAGLWGYNIGDTVKFVSLDPYKIVVTGRIKHFISAFGEHVIGEEVEAALLQVAAQTNTSITEFTVAPFVAGVDAAGKSYHEWFISFEKPPANLDDFAAQLDNAMRQHNVYYDDLIKGAILEPLKIRTLQSDAFVQYMRSIGKLGGQNKVPRLSNDRVLADALSNYLAPLL